jgi:hypothetical protein
MKDEQIAKNFEKWIHIGSVVVWDCTVRLGSRTCTVTLVWVLDAEPLRCHRRDDVDCIRGEDAYIYAWLYSGIPETFLF